MTDMPSLRTAGLFVHTGRFSNNTALIQSPEADQHQSEISPLTASESFTQRRRRSIGAGSLHANGSVNGATVATCPVKLILIVRQVSGRKKWQVDG